MSTPLPIVRVIADPQRGERTVVAFLQCPCCGQSLDVPEPGTYATRCRVCGECVDIARVCNSTT